jgi:hypothetical protein
MRKLRITESQFKTLTAKVTEDVQSQANPVKDSMMQSVLDGKRGVGFTTYALPETVQVLKDAGIHLIPTALQNGYVYYRDGFEKEADTLFSIVRKNGGYLSMKSPEEMITIGTILKYNMAKIQELISQRFPNYNG